VRGYLMDEEYDIDIDVPEDWERAEQKFQELKKRPLQTPVS